MSNPAHSKPVDAAEVRGQLVGKHVCPFCGVLRPDASQPCARCTLEDTPATRSATKQRIGPWFVLQARNPSAPGMKLATLQSLIRRGQITPRSIVRGPTTDQMWAFAANARGLSREFGLCYACNESIDPVSTRCVHCGKPQDLPADADALLETLAASGAAAMFPSPQVVASSPPAPPSDVFSSMSVKLSDTGMDGGTSLDLQADPLPPITPLALSSPVAPAAEVRPRQPASPARQIVQRAAAPMTKEESILSARELATAFQLDFKPTGRGKKARRPVRTLMALLLIVLIAGGIVLTLRQDWRKITFDYAKDTWAKLSAKLEQPAQPVTFNPSTRPGAGRTPPAANQTPKPVPAIPEPAKTPTSEPQVTPPPTPTQPVETVVVAPPPAVVEPVQPPAVTPTPPPEHVEPSPAVESLTIEQATALASDLRIKAIDAQGRGDWAGALKLYEQIQRLPRDAWPADLTMRLELARKRAGGGG